VVVFFLSKIIHDKSAFIIYYEKNLRGSLFSGFLTVGGFLLSLKTFIIIKLKENVYDHPEYLKRFNEMKKLDHGLELYSPLCRLADFLFWAVLSTIVAAILQLTLGLIGFYLPILIVLWISIFAIILLIYSLIIIRSNLNDYFKFINNVNNKNAQSGSQRF